MTETPVAKPVTRRRRWKIALATVALLLSVWAAIIVQARLALRAELEAIRREGYPADVEDLFASYPEPTDPHGGLLFERAYAALDFKVVRSTRLPYYYGSDEMPQCGEPWPDEMRSAAAQFLDDNREAIRLYDEAASMGRAWFPYDFNPGSGRGVEDGRLYAGSTLMSLRAEAAIREDQADQAQAALITHWRMANVLRDHPSPRALYLRRELVYDAAVSTEVVTHHVALSDDQMRQLMEAARATDDDRAGLLRAVAAHRAAMHVHIQNYPSRPGKLASLIHRLMWASSLLDRNDLAYLRLAREDFKLVREGKASDAIIRQMQAELPWRNPLMRIWYISSDDTVAADNSRRMAADVTVVGLAALIYRNTHGSLPDELEQLTAGIVDAIPLDRFGAGPLKYRRVGDGAIIYSVGPDGVDDGGRELNPQGIRFHKKHNDITFTIGDAQRELWPAEWVDVLPKAESTSEE